MVETFGDEFLAGTPLADDENGPVERSGAARPLYGVEEGKTLADELFGTFHGSQSKIRPTVGGKSHHLARIFTDFGREKSMNLRKMAVSGYLAWLLLYWKQV